MRLVALVLVLFFSATAWAGIWDAEARRGQGGETPWFRLAGERTRVGDYDGALDAYERLLAAGDAQPVTLVNSAELLMALGRLPEAIDRYREAVEIEGRAPDRREHLQGLALAYFGLSVSLDRAGRAGAARDAMAAAVALDPGLGILSLAAQAGSALSFVPPGDVFYYLGLARETQGRNDDAAAAFRDYLRLAQGKGQENNARFARKHLAALNPGGLRAPPPPAVTGAGAATGSRLRLHVIHHATLVADGPLVAPLIDAAWRLDARLLDACLSDVALAEPQSLDSAAPARREFRISLDLHIEDTGRVSAATAKVPAALGAVVASCIEDAVKTRLRVSRPAGRKPTHARMELVLAPAAPGGL